MSHTLSYYHRLGGGQTKYGPATLTKTVEEFSKSTVETFEFCHNQNSQSRSNTTDASVSVGGVLKAFDVGATVSTSFSTASEKASQNGKEIREYSEEYVRTTDVTEIKLSQGQFLAYYVLVDVFCYTVNGGAKQVIHVPGSDVFCQPMDEAEMKIMSQGSIFFENASWRVVADRYHSIELDNIRTEVKLLTPINISANPYLDMGKIAIRSVSSKKYLDGRNPEHNEVWITARNPIGDKYLQWTVEMYDGYYAFKSVSSGQYLDGRNSSYASKDGALWVTNRNPSGDKYLQWKIETVDGKLALKSVSSGLYIDGRNANYSANQVWLGPRSPVGNAYYHWTFEKV
jgi:hypothetical protein